MKTMQAQKNTNRQSSAGTTHAQIPTLVEILLAKFNGQLLIAFLEAIAVIGYNRQTARNELSKKTFPIRTVLQGGRRYICVTDLAAYLEKFQAESVHKSKAGRPTKASRIEAQKRIAADEGAK